jgi:hypothetical protein
LFIAHPPTGGGPFDFSIFRKMERKKFLHTVSILGLTLLIPVKTFSLHLFQASCLVVDDAIKAIRQIISALKGEGSSLTRKTLNGRKYVRDPSVFYPYDHSIEDEETSCQVFFHAHRPGEYGHFHTFINNDQGELVHLIMISMDKHGNPVGISTLNQWVTGDFFVSAEELKILFTKFRMKPDLFPEKRIIEFINYLFEGYQGIIFELFEERDRSINRYVTQNARQPFEDRDIEVLSYRKIDIFKD